MAYIIVSATSEQVGPGWTRTGITANLTGRQFPTRRVRPPDVPDAHELITLKDGRTAQWWSRDHYAVSDGTYLGKQEIEWLRTR